MNLCDIFDDWLIWNTLTYLKKYDYFKDFWEVHAGVSIAQQRVVLKEKNTQQTTCFNSKASYQLMVDPFLHLTVINWCFTKAIEEYAIRNNICFQNWLFSEKKIIIRSIKNVFYWFWSYISKWIVKRQCTIVYINVREFWQFQSLNHFHS